MKFKTKILFIMIKTYLILFFFLTLTGSSIYAQSNLNDNINKELKTERTMYSNVYLKDDGGREVVFSTSPVHYLKNGIWEPINTNIISNNTGFKNDENIIKSFFPKNISTKNNVKLLINSTDEISIHSVKKMAIFSEQSKLNILDVSSNSSTGIVDKNAIIYSDIFTGVSDEFIISNGKIKNNVILNSLPALLNNVSTGYFGFQEIIELPYGWEIKPLDETNDLLTSSSLNIFDSNGNHVLTISEPVFFDNYGEESDGSEMVVGKYLLKEEDGHWSLTTLVPIEWLKSDNTIYPIKIDPTVVLAGATGGWQSPVNFVDNPAYVFVGDCCGNGHHRAWIKFNTASIPDNTCITNVELQVYVNGVGGTALELVHANDVTGAPGPYGSITPAAFTDFGNGLYTSFTLGGVGTYGYYDLGVNADALLESQLPVDWFQVALMFDNEPSTNWKRMTGTSCNLRVTYGNCCPTADFTINTPICLGDTATATYTGTGSSAATTFDWNFVGGTPATANTIGPHDIIWTTAGSKTVSLEVNQTGCPTEIVTQTVVVNPSPVITATASPTAICIGSSSTVSATSSVGSTTYTWDNGLGAGSSHSVSPTATTTYTVTGSANGCTGTDNIIVTVNPSPVITATASPTAICIGSSSTVSSTSSVGGTTYNWDNGLGAGSSHSVSPTATTTYTVTGTANGCTGTANVNVNVTVNPPPTITATANPDSICLGSSSTISATSSVGGTTYNWSGLGAGVSHSVSPTSTTTYRNGKCKCNC